MITDRNDNKSSKCKERILRSVSVMYVHRWSKTDYFLVFSFLFKVRGQSLDGLSRWMVRYTRRTSSYRWTITQRKEARIMYDFVNKKRIWQCRISDIVFSFDNEVISLCLSRRIFFKILRTGDLLVCFCICCLVLQKNVRLVIMIFLNIYLLIRRIKLSWRVIVSDL